MLNYLEFFIKVFNESLSYLYFLLILNETT